MDANKKYRHELKYQISNAQLEMLQKRIHSIISLDSHAESAGMYTIRSLYFDDYNNRCYYENENGVDPREKFRIRIYNHNTDRITLECKRKERGKTFKTSCQLTLEQTKQLMEGHILKDIASQPPLLKKLTIQMLTHRLRPVVIVEYERVPFIYKNGNVRITLDKNIGSTKEVGCFLDEKLQLRPVLPTGHQLLEVKYDEYLPDFIYRSLQLHNLRQTAFSKYYICRKFTK